MVKVGTQNTERLSDKQLRKMIEFYGEDRIPDPLHYPMSFNYYVKIFKFLRGKNET